MGLKAWLSVANLFMRRYSRGNLGLLILCKPVSASQFFPLSLHLVPELGVWLKNTFEPRRVEYELHRPASTKFPAVSNLNNESLCINIDEEKSCSWNFATISDCLQGQKVSYCTKEATWVSTVSFLQSQDRPFEYIYNFLNNSEQRRSVSLTQYCWPLPVLIFKVSTSWPAHFYLIPLIILL